MSVMFFVDLRDSSEKSPERILSLQDLCELDLFDEYFVLVHPHVSVIDFSILLGVRRKPGLPNIVYLLLQC